MAEETTSPVYAMLQRFRRLGEQNREKMERVWEISHKLVDGNSARDFVNGTGMRGAFQPTVNLIANSVNTKYAELTEMAERPVITPRGADAPAVIYFSLVGKEKAAAVPLPTDQKIAELEMRKLLTLPNPESTAQKNQAVEQHQAAIADLNDQGLSAQAAGADTTAIQQQLQQVQASLDQAIQMPVEPLFNDEDFVLVTDDFAADALTQEIQTEWLRCKADMVFNKHKFQKVVIGHSDMLVEWNAEKKNIQFKKVDPYNMWIDPFATNTFDAEFVIVRQIYTVEKAKKMWPEHAEDIERKKNTLNGSEWKNGFGRLGEASNYPADSEVVEYIIAWVRDSEVDSVEPDPETGELATVPVPLRQIEMLGDIVIDDGECPLSDIPVSRDINIPRSESNYGVGDPEYLWDLQNIFHRLVHIVYENALYSRASMHLVPVSVLDQIRNYLERAYTMAGQFIPIADDQFQIYNGQPIRQMDPPQLNPVIFQTITMILQLFDRMSGNTNISRGEAYSGWSGELYQQATANAKTPVAMTARHTVHHIKYLMGVALRMILDNLTAEDLADRNQAYSIEVWQCILDRISKIEYDFEVQVSAGQKKTADAARMAEMSHNNPGLMNSEEFVKMLFHKADIPDADRIAKQVVQQMQSQPQPS